MDGSRDQSPTGSETVHPVVRKLLRQHESDDSLTTGTIVDIATISPSKPYENFEIDSDKIINSSEQLIKSVVTTDRYHDCIAIAVELPNGEIFVDLFTYKSSDMGDYPSIESLAMALSVDVSSVHHLIGKQVNIIQEDNRWVICEHKDTPSTTPTVSMRDFVTPLMISIFLTPLGVFTGMFTSISIIVTTGIGVLGTVICYSFLLYLTLAAKRDHPLPGILGTLFAPDYTGESGRITEDNTVTDVQQGEFKRLTTLVDEDEYESPRAVLHNLAVVVVVPPDGEKTIPIPSPATGWRGTVIKSLVFTLSSSVEALDQSKGKLIPLAQEDDRIKIDRESLKLKETTRDRTFFEKIADRYVGYINDVLRTPVRDDVYT